MRSHQSMQRLIREPAWNRGYLDLAKASGADADLDGFDRNLRRSLVLDPLSAVAREYSLGASAQPGWQKGRVFDREFRRCLVAYPNSAFGLWKGAQVLKFSDERLPEAKGLIRRALAAHPQDRTIRELAWKLEDEWGWSNKGVVGSYTLPEGAKETIPRFFRTSNARFFPKELSQIDDLDRVLREDIFYGYLPKQPQIASGRSIVAMGSCFAQHIRQHLLRRGHQSDHVPVPEGLNNTFAIRQFVEWASGTADHLYSFEKTDENRMQRWEADKDRDAFRRALREAGGFVVTIGVAEVWQDRRTGGVFWRGIPEALHDPEIHEHRLSTVEENVDNLLAVSRSLKDLAGDVPVVFTLSPVPLIATMRQDMSIFAADAVSKSVLRLAIDQVMQRREPGIHYWPSFEAFRWLGAHQERRLYDGENNPRHPSTDMIARMVDLFVHTFIA